MRRLLMVGVLAVGSAGLAHAADPPSVMGSWTGKGHSISAGQGWETERSYTLVVTEQRGPGSWAATSGQADRKTSSA
jgi:opacity protein-like surface antigen